jgi:hypothetical protein
LFVEGNADQLERNVDGVYSSTPGVDRGDDRIETAIEFVVVDRFLRMVDPTGAGIPLTPVINRREQPGCRKSVPV